MAKNAFVTLATNDEYAIGALCLAQSIRNVGTQADLIILITNGVSESFLNLFSNVFTKVVKVDELNSGNSEILNLIQRPELAITITKINAWQLIEYEKCVFLDADCLVLKSVDELFERPQLSAVCDLGWPDCFNSGVFVFKPDTKTYLELLELLKTEDSFDGGDQGLLNVYFADWLDSDIKKRLPFIYNMHSTSLYTYPPAFKRFGQETKIVHFLGTIKPWMYNYNITTGAISSNFKATHHIPFVQSWWNIFVNQIKSKLPTNLCLFSSNENNLETSSSSCTSTTTEIETCTEGIAGKMATLEINQPDEDYNRKKQWEAGNIDYLGVDSFANIQKKLDESIGKN